MLLVPHNEEGMEAGMLPSTTRASLKAVAGIEGAVKAGDVALALGKGVQPAPVEPLRGQLRCLADRGRLQRTPAGRHSLAGTRTGPTTAESTRTTARYSSR